MNNKEWTAWTAAKTAIIPPNDDDGWFCPLHDFSLITAAGKDASSFINNQLTNDLSLVSDQRAQLSAYCNPKGRTYCCFLIFRRNGSYYLRTMGELASQILKRLQMYVLRAEVELNISELVGIGIGGANAASLAEKICGHCLNTPGQMINDQETTIIRSFDNVPRYEIYAPLQQSIAYWEKLTALAVAADASMWIKHDILSGIPNLDLASTEQFVPQMLNLDLLGAVSFSKGCYPGQEIVSRTHYLGKLKQRLYRFSASDKNLKPGSLVYVPAYDAKQPSGKIINTYADTDETIHGLAVMRIRGIETNQIYADEEQTVPLRIKPLPYEVLPDSIDIEKQQQ